jgi:hypothetical protein
LQRFQPVIMMELNPGALKEFGHDAQAAAGLLREHGYQLFKTHRGGLIPLMHLPKGKEHLSVIALPKRLRKGAASLNWHAVTGLGGSAPR